MTNTTAASKYIPRRLRISVNWNPPFQTSLHKISKVVFFGLTTFFFMNKKNLSKKQLLFSFLCIVKQKKNSEWSVIFWNFLIFKNYNVNWDPPWRISIHRDFDSLGGPLSPCGSHWLRLEPFTQIRSRTLCCIISHTHSCTYRKLAFFLHVHVRQLFSAEPTMFKKKIITHETLRLWKLRKVLVHTAIFAQRVENTLSTR